jgi:hypothetical protein
MAHMSQKTKEYDPMNMHGDLLIRSPFFLKVFSGHAVPSVDNNVEMNTKGSFLLSASQLSKRDYQTNQLD